MEKVLEMEQEKGYCFLQWQTYIGENRLCESGNICYSKAVGLNRSKKPKQYEIVKRRSQVLEDFGYYMN